MDARDIEHGKEGAKSKMSEGEIAILHRAIRDLSEKTDRQHAANQASQAQDRDTFRNTIQTQQQTFAAAMNSQREAFQEALNKQFLEHTALDRTVYHHSTMIENIVGDGQPGRGRLGVLETGMELMKKFRWQALAVIALMMWAVETWTHHGR